MNYPTPHSHHFHPNNHLIGMRTLSKDLIEKSESFFGNTLWQTNTDNQLSFKEYNDEFQKKAKIFFDEAINQNHNSFVYKFSCVLFSTYLSNLDNFLNQKDSIIKPKYLIKSPLRYTKYQNIEKNFLIRLFLKPIRIDHKTVLSNKSKVDVLLDYLTEIFFIEDKKHFGLEQIWTLFLENLYSYKKKFEDEEKHIKILSKKHYKTFITRAKPFSWGWYEIHIKCFSDGFVDTLADSLNLKSDLVTNSKELDKIYEFSKMVLTRMEFADKNEEGLKNFSTLGDYIKPNILILSEAIEYYESTIIIAHDDDTFIAESINYQDNLAKTTYAEEIFNISKNLNIDFIDYFKGKSRGDRETNFLFIVDLLIKNMIVVSDSQFANGVLWLDDDKRFKGKRIRTFIQTLIVTGWIHKPDEKVTNILEKFIHCFGISSLDGISERNFSFKKTNEIMTLYANIFDFIPQYQDKYH